MASRLQIISLLSLACIASSRLMFLNQSYEAYERSKQFWNENLISQNPGFLISQNSSSSSTANPVAGIANATSGYLNVDQPNQNSKLFYIFYECSNIPKDNNPTDIPIIIWLQGGPGSSSMLGNFFENGPYGLEYDEGTKKFKEVKKQFSWNDYYHYMAVDNPRGTGYSIADGDNYATSSEEVARDFVQALKNFYELDTFKKYSKTPLFVFGESYAGHFVPSIGEAILKYNANQTTNDTKIPLEGIAVGDGWTDPINQISKYSTFGYSLGLINDAEKIAVEGLQGAAILAFYQKKWILAQDSIQGALDLITKKGGNLNVYNFRDFGNYNFTKLDLFFNDEDTIKRYNIDPSVAGKFSDENAKIAETLSKSGDFMASVAEKVAYNIENGIRSMYYNGQDDIICNSPNQQVWINKVQWQQRQQFYDAPFQVWKYENQTVAGLAKNVDNLTFVVLNKAGHLSPMDQINTTTEMVRRFVGNDNNWNVTFKANDEKSVLSEGLEKLLE